jgi:predicted DNA-binding transcriptional regulator YafY
MPKSINQKSKLLYVLRYLEQHTDAEHPATVEEIISHLAANGISAERKSIYSDIDALIAFGADIEKCRSKTVGYYIASRTFELPELKLLVDAVQSSRFLTSKKSLKSISCHIESE